MNLRILAVVGPLLGLSPQVAAQTPATTPPPTLEAARQPAGRDLTLAEALGIAEAANPVLKMKLAELAEAEGTETDSQALLQSNPQLSIDTTRRKVPIAGVDAERRREWNAGLSQSIEIAGQQAHRRESASAALAALRLEISALRHQQRADVGQRFYRVLALQQRFDLEVLAAQLFADTAQAVERRRAAGEDTRLDANVALVESERAQNQVALIEENLVDARSALAQPLQLSAGQLPRVSGDLEPAPLPYTESELMERAISQPRLQALALRQQSAQARLKLERALRYPDITVGINVGREGAADTRERLATLSVSLPLPFFKRNASGIGAATTEAERTAIDRQSAEREVPASIHALWLRLQSLQQRVGRLQRTVVPTLATNERLTAKSLSAGQIGLLELIVTSRQAIDARRDLVDAQLDYHITRLSLEALAGLAGQ